MRILPPALVIAMLAFPAMPAAAEALSKQDREMIVREVVEHFRRNPQELVQAIVDWRKGQEEALRPASLAAPVSGNSAGDVTVFEFSDYGCEPCRRLSQAVDAVAAQDGSIRIVHHDYPVSGSDAVAASIDLYSAYARGGDWKSLRAAYLTEGVAPETRIAAMAAAGLENEDGGKDAAAALLTSNRALAAKAGVSEMPAVIVAAGDKVQALSGPLTQADLAAAVAAVRRAASTR